MDNTTDHVVPLRLVLLPCATESPRGSTLVKFEITGVVDPTQTSEVRLLIGVLGGTMICFSEEADVIFGRGLDAVFGFAAGLVAVFDYLEGLGGACMRAVVAVWVNLLHKHEMSHCVVWTSS